MAKTNPKVFQNPVATNGASRILRSNWRPSYTEIIVAIEQRLAAVLETASRPPTAAQRLEKLIATIRQSGTEA